MELRARGPETGSRFAASSDRQTMGENAALLLPETAAAAAETDETEHEPVVVEEKPSADADRPLHLVPPDTFETFFEQQYANLLRVMYLVTGNRHEAEEVTQDAFVRALERWDRVRAADNRPGYLYRIAVNLYRSKLRRVARAARKTLNPHPDAEPCQAADARAAVALLGQPLVGPHPPAPHVGAIPTAPAPARALRTQMGITGSTKGVPSGVVVRTRSIGGERVVLLHPDTGAQTQLPSDVSS